MNPIITQLASNNPLTEAAKLMQNGNPYQTFMQMAQGNPQMQPIVQMLQMGQSPETVFRNLCQQRGINADQFIQGLRIQ